MPLQLPTLGYHDHNLSSVDAPLDRELQRAALQPRTSDTAWPEPGGSLGGILPADALLAPAYRWRPNSMPSRRRARVPARASARARCARVGSDQAFSRTCSTKAQLVKHKDQSAGGKPWGTMLAKRRGSSGRDDLQIL